MIITGGSMLLIGDIWTCIFLGGVSISLDVGSITILELVTISSADSGSSNINWS